MPYYTKDKIAQARALDLLTYLRQHEPNELVHFSGNTYPVICKKFISCVPKLLLRSLYKQRVELFFCESENNPVYFAELILSQTASET